MNTKIISFLVSVIACVSMQAQTTLTLQSDKNDVSAAEAGSYDRVEYVRQVREGTTVLISFPAKLDGYYFGPDAERYLVTAVTEGADGKLSIVTETMPDTLDFIPGKKYLVSPTQNLETIVSLSPAKKTIVNQTAEDLVCRVVDNHSTAIADITVVNKNSDATLYDITGKRMTATGRAGIYIIRNRKVMIR